MKTINFFFVSLFYCLVVQSVYSQQGNVVSNTNVPSPSFQNVLVGVNAGDNLTTLPLINGNNVMVGFNSGTNSNSTSAPGMGADCARNTFVGALSGQNNTTGSDNIFVGFDSGRHVTTGEQNISIKSLRQNDNNSGLPFTGSGNTMVGYLTGEWMTTGMINSFFGNGAGRAMRSGNYNLHLGYNAGSGIRIGNDNICIGQGSNQAPFTNFDGGTENIYIGSFAAQNNVGTRNTMLGYRSGEQLTAGSFNTFLGYVQVPNSPSTATTAGNNTVQTIILADGGFNQRLYIHSNGFTGIGLGNNTIPRNRLDVNGAVVIGTNYTPRLSPAIPGFVGPANGMLVEGSVGIGNSNPNNKVEITQPSLSPNGASGLRFSNLPNTKDALPNPLGKVLSVNGTGDVILVNDIGTTGITQNCSTANFVPLNSTTANQLICSQIYDNSTSGGIGTSVSIGYTTPPSFSYTGNTITDFIMLAPSSGTARLRVNGVTWSSGFFALSDKNFKKDIKPIRNALTIIEKLEGKTYLWNKEANKDMNFDGGGHSGFIAQELEKVLPHLVATSGNGEKAVNYIELLPYLVEAIKDQQSQIEDLKNQLSEKFKAQNQELIGLENTKIISVSPNPSNDLISISLNVEESVQNATLQVHDLNGKLLSNLVISDRANNITKTLQKDNFGKGIYIVSLVVNGKSVDAKKIIFN